MSGAPVKQGGERQKQQPPKRNIDGKTSIKSVNNGKIKLDLALRHIWRGIINNRQRTKTARR